jgi:uncharacterized protein
MKCPIDNAELVMTDRQGIEIDYCPQCRGVWLDRGELDKIIERAAGAPAAPPPQQQATFAPPPPPPPQQQRHYDDDRDYDRRYQQQHHDPRYGHRRKKSFLGDLFDFD